MDILSSVANFITDVLIAVENLVLWSGDLAETINEIDLQTTGIADLIANYRFLVGETIFLAFITCLYVGLFLMALRIVPIFVSWWKQFSPFN